MGKEYTDEELMLSYSDGDASAFETLYQRHKSSLYRYILRQCKQESLAEEIFQDVWMNIINARTRYEVKAKFSTYLYQVAHNRVIDHYRKQKNVSSTNSESEIEDIPSRVEEQPEHKTELQNRTEHLFALIEQLPSEQREAFILREEGGLSVNEIAEATGVNPETAKSRLRYAVNKLREGLSES